MQVSEQTDNPVLLKQNNFEGPVELLFHLLEKNEMDIYDIDINAIADQYLEYLSEWSGLIWTLPASFLLWRRRCYILSRECFYRIKSAGG